MISTKEQHDIYVAYASRATEKAESACRAIYAIFWPIARILMFCDKKYRMLRICDKKYCILTSGSVWLSMARCPAHSGPLWLSVARSPALSGSLWLPLAPSGSLWLSIALQICLPSPCSAHKALAQLGTPFLRSLTLISPGDNI